MYQTAHSYHESRSSLSTKYKIKDNNNGNLAKKMAKYQRRTLTKVVHNHWNLAERCVEARPAGSPLTVVAFRYLPREAHQTLKYIKV